MDLAQLLVMVGRRVAELRLARGWTQERFAERAGLDVRQLQRVEQGALPMTLRRLLLLANALGVDPLELLREPTEPDAGPGRRPTAGGPSSKPR